MTFLLRRIPCCRRKRRVLCLASIAGVTFAYFIVTHSLLLTLGPQSSASELEEYELSVSVQTTAYTDMKSKPKPACTEKRNFVFIKQMKCATSTLLGTWYRFGYKRNLTFVSPVKTKLYLNWPYPMTSLDFRPSSIGYNILTEHSIYTPEVMESLMPRDSVYLSILRHPFHQVQSMFQYFKVAQVAQVPADKGDIFVQYFDDLSNYEKRFTGPDAKGRMCIPTGFSMTKNLMSHCMGMPLGFPPGRADISKQPDKVDEYIKYIDKKFDLIMIVEYFYESLILLRRMMCWQFSDLLFMSVNVAQYSFDTKNVPKRVTDLHREWSSIDYKLYDYFNQTFLKKMSAQGEDFHYEVSALQKMSERLTEYCRSLYPMGERPHYRYPGHLQSLTIPASNWTSEFKVHPEDCWMLAPDPYRLYRLVQIENDFSERELLEKQAKILDSRKYDEKGQC